MDRGGGDGEGISPEHIHFTAFSSNYPLRHHLSSPSSDFPPICRHICGKNLSLTHTSVLLKPAHPPLRRVSPDGPVEETNIFNISYSHTNLILATLKKCGGNIFKTDLSLMFFLGYRMCKMTSMFNFIYNYTRVPTLCVKSA